MRTTVVEKVPYARMSDEIDTTRKAVGFWRKNNHNPAGCKSDAFEKRQQLTN
jgi:hypothetical protein